VIHHSKQTSRQAYETSHTYAAHGLHFKQERLHDKWFTYAAYEPIEAVVQFRFANICSAFTISLGFTIKEGGLFQEPVLVIHHNKQLS
jgi:hypothetical protein